MKSVFIEDLVKVDAEIKSNSTYILNNLKERNIRIYRTDLDGTIKMELDYFKKLKIYKTILN